MLRRSIASILAAFAIGLLGFTSFTAAMFKGGDVAYLDYTKTSAFLHDDTYQLGVHVTYDPESKTLSFQHDHPHDIPVKVIWGQNERSSQHVDVSSNHQVFVGPGSGRVHFDYEHFGHILPAPGPYR